MFCIIWIEITGWLDYPIWKQRSKRGNVATHYAHTNVNAPKYFIFLLLLKTKFNSRSQRVNLKNFFDTSFVNCCCCCCIFWHTKSAQYTHIPHEDDDKIKPWTDLDIYVGGLTQFRRLFATFNINIWSCLLYRTNYHIKTPYRFICNALLAEYLIIICNRNLCNYRQ